MRNPFRRKAMPVIPVNHDILNQTRDEYRGYPSQRPYEPYEDYGARTRHLDRDHETVRSLEKEWDRAARHAIATGRLTPAEAVARGYRPSGYEADSNSWAPYHENTGSWKPLPKKLYHVTTNLPDVLKSGVLRSRHELDLNGVNAGRGLGGGDDETISLTDDPTIAHNILMAMREGADVASGRLPIHRLVEMAEKGEGAKEPWLRKMFGDHDWSRGNPRALDDLLLGRKPFYSHLLPEGHPLKGMSGGFQTLPAEEWAQYGYYPYEDAYALGSPEKPIYTAQSVYRHLSPEEQAHEAFEWWRNPYAPMRGWSGGPPDPLFTSVDPEWFAKVNPNHIGVVEAQPVKNGHGYPMGSLKEWRVPTGDAVNITGVNGKPWPVVPTQDPEGQASLFDRTVASAPANGPSVNSQRVGAETRTQKLRRAAEVEAAIGAPDQSEVVHAFPDGWTIRRPTTWSDVYREGALMHNCWNGDYSDSPAGMWASHPQGDWLDPDEDDSGVDIPYGPLSEYYEDAKAAGHPVLELHHRIDPAGWSNYPHSLRDPDNIPHVSFYSGLRSNMARVDQPLGMKNSDPKPEYMARVNEWASTRQASTPSNADSVDPYEIRPADEGWFSHDTGTFVPRFDSRGGDTLTTKHGQGDGRVAYYNGEPVASVTWQGVPGGIMLGSAYTHPEHRGKGLFNRLTEELRAGGQPIDAFHWDNPWLKNKVRDWSRMASAPPNGGSVESVAVISPEQVMEHMRALHKGSRGRSRVDNDIWWERMERKIHQHPSWTRTQHPLASIAGVGSLDVEPDRVNSLAQMPGPMPEVVIDHEGTLLDGWHRATVAHRRGDTHLPAYIPAAPAKASSVDQERTASTPLHMDWTPGEWGKGFLVNNEPVMWNVRAPGLAPHHDDVAATRCPWPQDYECPIVIHPSGWYTLSDSRSPDPNAIEKARRFAGGGLRFAPTYEHWEKMTRRSSVASARVRPYYRLLPSSIREQVLAEGMVPNPVTGNPMHFWDNLPEARRYAEICNGIEPHDLWEVHPRAVGRLKRDPWFKQVPADYWDPAPGRGRPGAWQSDVTHIAPERLRLVDDQDGEVTPSKTSAVNPPKRPYLMQFGAPCPRCGSDLSIVPEMNGYVCNGCSSGYTFGDRMKMHEQLIAPLGDALRALPETEHPLGPTTGSVTPSKWASVDEEWLLCPECGEHQMYLEQTGVPTLLCLGCGHRQMVGGDDPVPGREYPFEDMGAVPGEVDPRVLPEGLTPRQGATPHKSVKRRPHSHITTGQPCTCPWGAHTYMGRTASKFDWLAARPDMQTPEGEEFLRFLDEQGYRQADKLLPWVVREWRKGRLIPNDVGGLGVPGPGQSPLNPQTLAEIQRDLDQMKKARQGIDIMQLGAPELLTRITDWRADQEAKARKDLGEVVHEFPDGWTVRQLNNRHEMRDEGDMMGHCVGSYGDDAELGSSVFLSLRDRKNHPHATLQMTPDHAECANCGHDYGRYGHGQQCDHCGGVIRARVGPGSETTEYKGRSNQDVDDEYNDRMNEYLGTKGAEAAAYQPWWDDTYHMDGPESLTQLVGYNGGYVGGREHHLPDMHPYAQDQWYENEPEDYRIAQGDADEHGVEGPDLEIGDPNYEKIIGSMIEPDRFESSWNTWQDGRNQRVQVQPGYRPEWANFLLQHAKEAGHEDYLREALTEHMADNGVADWRKLRPLEFHQEIDPIAAQYYNHLGGALIPRWRSIEPYDPRPRPKRTPPGQETLFDRTVAKRHGPLQGGPVQSRNEHEEDRTHIGAGRPDDRRDLLGLPGADRAARADRRLSALPDAQSRLAANYKSEADFMAAEMPHWSLDKYNAQGHPMYSWPDANGNRHIVTGFGSVHGGGRGQPVPVQIGNIRRQLQRCEQGACDHVFTNAEHPMAQPVSTEDAQALFQRQLTHGQRVLLNGQPHYVTDIVNDPHEPLVSVVHAETGEENIVPPSQLRAARVATDFRRYPDSDLQMSAWNLMVNGDNLSRQDAIDRLVRIHPGTTPEMADKAMQNALMMWFEGESDGGPYEGPWWKRVIEEDINDSVKPDPRIPKRQGNVLDPIRDTLDPTVWDDPASPTPRLKHEHRLWIMDSIYSILSEAGYTGCEKWGSLYLTGSLTTYQYADHSDVDVSLFVDAEQFPEWSRSEMIGLMIQACDGLIMPGTTHELQTYVVARGIKPADLYQPGLRSGYNVIQDKWLVPPQPDLAHDPEHEENEAYTQALINADKMDRLLRYEPDKAVMFYRQLHRKRMRDQAAGKGDFAASNLTYKMLDNRGLLQQVTGLLAGAKLSSDVPDYFPEDWTPEPDPNTVPNHLITEYLKSLPPDKAEAEAETMARNIIEQQKAATGMDLIHDGKDYTDLLVYMKKVNLLGQCHNCHGTYKVVPGTGTLMGLPSDKCAYCRGDEKRPPPPRDLTVMKESEHGHPVVFDTTSKHNVTVEDQRQWSDYDECGQCGRPRSAHRYAEHELDEHRAIDEKLGYPRRSIEDFQGWQPIGLNHHFDGPPVEYHPWVEPQEHPNPCTETHHYDRESLEQAMRMGGGQFKDTYGTPHELINEGGHYRFRTVSEHNGSRNPYADPGFKVPVEDVHTALGYHQP
ncbi:PcfJ domain-containing protein [Candidatus Solirubrobacter pratensis]|uniref:PcfJ domain-containing protein n=1 Tax=Candidatus Solirubrobacter pratensis TaxID=1298857 RepID=UPI00041EC009|nr:PcfJ domain-containing protein [Candidatus Solirubrobacter pratensis]